MGSRIVITWPYKVMVPGFIVACPAVGLRFVGVKAETHGVGHVV